MRIYLTSSTSEIYEFSMSLFNSGETEEFWLFVRSFNMTLTVLGTLEAVAKVQYLCALVRGEALCQFVSLSDYVESTTPLTVEYIIRGNRYTLPL